MRIKAISLYQPWATLVSIGAKKFETRGWHTAYRGPLAIHAAKRWTEQQRVLCDSEPFRSALKQCEVDRGVDAWGNPYGHWHDLPLGCIVATARLTNVYPMETVTRKFLQPNETAFGDFSAGRFAWELSDVALLTEPVPCKGRQGFFWVELEGAA